MDFVQRNAIGQPLYTDSGTGRYVHHVRGRKTNAPAILGEDLNALKINVEAINPELLPEI